MARVAVDVSLAHLDRPFDYLVPEQDDAVATPGTRVRVRFAGRLVGGFVLDRVDASEHHGRLAFLASAVSAEPALTSEIARLARAVADHYAGTMPDVLRLAVPPRHARVEAERAPSPAGERPPKPEARSWARYPAGPGLVETLAAGSRPRAVWAALPGPSWVDEIAITAGATLASGRGVVIVVPDSRDVGRLDTAMADVLGPGRHVVLSAELGPAERYRRWLAVRRGAVRAVVGTRSAVFAPVANLGLVVVWDDGDDLHAEPRAPHPHARDVSILRAHLAGAGALIGGHAVSTEGADLVQRGWARALGPSREALRAAAPRVEAVGDDARASDPAARASRVPSAAWRIAREALAEGAPVLVGVPRRGYQPALACADCRTSARCPSCGGLLARARPPATGAVSAPAEGCEPTATLPSAGRPGDGPGSDGPALACRWCGARADAWQCAECGSEKLRANVVGEGRTVEELGRAFPGVPVRTSRGGSVLGEMAREVALVVATPGAEPAAQDGYGAALLLDGWALLTRSDLRAGEEALRRWLNAAALVRGGGRVAVVADAGAPPAQALIRWAPGWLAERELAERTELGFPPATRMAVLEGDPAAVRSLLKAADLPATADVLGPVEAAPEPNRAGDAVARALIRVPREAGAALARSLQQAQAARSAHKQDPAARVRLDPLDVG